MLEAERQIPRRVPALYPQREPLRGLCAVVRVQEPEDIGRQQGGGRIPQERFMGRAGVADGAVRVQDLDKVGGVFGEGAETSLAPAERTARGLRAECGACGGARGLVDAPLVGVQDSRQTRYGAAGHERGAAGHARSSAPIRARPSGEEAGSVSWRA